ncbi:MAG: DNA polymerase Y family protein [Betaproteobacteria bacterium]
MYAALLAPDDAGAALVAVARDFSPRYESHGGRAIAVDVSGLGRLFGDARAIGKALAEESSARGLPLHVALARTWTAALVLVHARSGITIVEPGREAAALAPLGLDLICRAAPSGPPPPVPVFKQWGLRTLGELAALPDADLVARLGRSARIWQAIARGEDARPLVPAVDEERFEASLELEWPIEGQEPLSFVLTRLLEPLSTRLERRDRGAAVLHVALQLVTRAAGAARELYARRLELPSPIRDVRTLRTLALLDLESHPPPAAIDAVTVFIEPTPARVLQHTLFTRAQPQPEQVTTLVARLNALMGQDRVGSPAAVDSYRPGAFATTPFTELSAVSSPEPLALSPEPCVNPRALIRALRRWRRPIAARVSVENGRPVRVTTDRRAFGGGAVLEASGPWRTSGEWWASAATREAESLRSRPSDSVSSASAWGWGPTRRSNEWDRSEWDVALADGARYRIFEDRLTGGWFIDAVID